MTKGKGQRPNFKLQIPMSKAGIEGWGLGTGRAEGSARPDERQDGGCAWGMGGFGEAGSSTGSFRPVRVCTIAPLVSWQRSPGPAPFVGCCSVGRGLFPACPLRPVGGEVCFILGANLPESDDRGGRLGQGSTMPKMPPRSPPMSVSQSSQAFGKMARPKSEIHPRR
jgi:hypothetical protein